MKKYIKLSTSYSEYNYEMTYPEGWEAEYDICTYHFPQFTIHTDDNGEWHTSEAEDRFYEVEKASYLDKPTVMPEDYLIETISEELSLYIDDEVKSQKSKVIEISGEIPVEIVYPVGTTSGNYNYKGDIDLDQAEINFIDFSKVNINVIEREVHI